MVCWSRMISPAFQAPTGYLPFTGAWSALMKFLLPPPLRCVNVLQSWPGRRDELPVVRQLDVLARLDRDVVDVEAEVDDLAVEVGVDRVLRRRRRRQDVLLRDRHVLGGRLLVVLLDAGEQQKAQRNRSSTAGGRASHAGFLTKAGGICNARACARRSAHAADGNLEHGLRARRRLADEHPQPSPTSPSAARARERRARRCRRGARSRARAAGDSPATPPRRAHAQRRRVRPSSRPCDGRPRPRRCRRAEPRAPPASAAIACGSS